MRNEIFMEGSENLMNSWDTSCGCMLSHFSCVWLCTTLRTITSQDLLSMGFSRQEYWIGLPCPPPGDLSDLGIEPSSLVSYALAGRFFTTSNTREALLRHSSSSSSKSLQSCPTPWDIRNLQLFWKDWRRS